MMKNLPAGQLAMVEQILQQMDELEKEGLTMINLNNCWLGRRLVPLVTRVHPMWNYTEQNDPSRLTAAEWKEGEYAAALKKITRAKFMSLDEGLKSFMLDKMPTPTVS
jgi:hypothetical protein